MRAGGRGVRGKVWERVCLWTGAEFKMRPRSGKNSSLHVGVNERDGRGCRPENREPHALVIIFRHGVPRKAPVVVGTRLRRTSNLPRCACRGLEHRGQLISPTTARTRQVRTMLKLGRRKKKITLCLLSASARCRHIHPHPRLSLHFTPQNGRANHPQDRRHRLGTSSL